MASKSGYSPRKLGTIIDLAHIIIGILVMIMASFAILRPARYMFLFPVIFLLAAILSIFNAWFLFKTYQRNARKKAAGIIYLILGIFLLALFVISAVSIWING